tara:strand:+ start:1090 stop:2442 length:1353 start_codon:yes stop_codon:yes gene_type:complete
MFIEQFFDKGLAHLSYMVWDEEQAVVIDPRQDIQDYLDLAIKKKVTITHIFETHRNEDYVIGSRTLASQTGAKIYHGRGLNFAYGQSINENDEFKLSSIKFKILETPGHTPESISLALYHLKSCDAPFAVFTGDALFVGSVGRTDLWKTRDEASGILFDSIYNKLLPLGDHVLLYPAHGAGSVCGDGMGSHHFSTIGYEKKYNEFLQDISKDQFIKKQRARHFDNPPYFKEMEKQNQKGPEIIQQTPTPRLVTTEELQNNDIDQIVDVRSPEAYSGVAIPNSISIPHDMISSFAGWFLEYNQSIILIAENQSQLKSANIQLQRLGYTNIKGWFPGLHDWEITGNNFWHIPAIHAETIKKRLETGHSSIILDVRSEKEWRDGHLPGAKHLFLGDLTKQMHDIPDKSHVTTFCGSGKRATIAASLLKKHDFKHIEICFGSMAACQAIGCPIV